MEEVVETVRRNVSVDVQKQRDQTQSLHYFIPGDDPRLVMMTANKLASLFIEENLNCGNPSRRDL